MSEKLTSKKRAYLMSISNALDPLFQVGKANVTPEFVQAVDDAFRTRELLKIGVLKNCADDPKEIAETIAGRTRSQVVMVVGKKIILYRENPDKKDDGDKRSV